MNRRQRRRFWIIGALCSLVLAPLLGRFWLMLGAARGLGAFGAPSSQRPDTLSATLFFLARLPLPLDTLGGWVFNGVCWGILLSLLLAAAVVRPWQAVPDGRQGFPVEPQPHRDLPED